MQIGFPKYNPSIWDKYSASVYLGVIPSPNYDLFCLSEPIDENKMVIIGDNTYAQKTTVKCEKPPLGRGLKINILTSLNSISSNYDDDPNEINPKFMVKFKFLQPKTIQHNHFRMPLWIIRLQPGSSISFISELYEVKEQNALPLLGTVANTT